MAGASVAAKRWFALWLAFAAALLWPAVINGGAFWFPDSPSYIRSADAAFVVATGQRSEWSDRFEKALAGKTAAPAPTVAAAVVSPGTAAAAGPAAGPKRERPVIGRSIYYGMLIYLPMRVFGPWGAIAMQALLVGAAILFALAMAMRHRAAGQLPRAAGVAAVIAVLTPLPFYVCMLMPDVWSGVTVALMALIVVYRARMSRLELAASWLAVAITATFHNSHVLLAFALGLAGVLAALDGRSRVLAPVLGLAAAAAGLAAGALFTFAVQAQTGIRPISPPFLSARLTASGPGLAYLDSVCPSPSTPPSAASAVPFALCRYRARLPQHSDNFLWSEQSENGVFQLAAPADQRRIAAEDKRFFLAVVAHDPAAYLGSFVQATGATLLKYNMRNFNYHEGRRDFSQGYPANIAREAHASRAVANTMPTGFTRMAAIALSLVSLALVAWAVTALVRGRWPHRDAALRYALLLVLGVFANAVICGALSKPDSRYQMRMQWVLPFAALVLVVAGRRRDSESALR